MYIFLFFSSLYLHRFDPSEITSLLFSYKQNLSLEIFFIKRCTFWSIFIRRVCGPGWRLIVGTVTGETTGQWETYCLYHSTLYRYIWENLDVSTMRWQKYFELQINISLQLILNFKKVKKYENIRKIFKKSFEKIKKNIF